MSHCCRMIQNSIRFPWVQLTLNNYLSISNIWVKWLALISLGALLGGVQGANHRNGSMQHTTADRTVNSASGVASEIMSIHGSVDAETSNLSEEDEPDQFVRNCIIVSQNGRQEYIPKSNVSNLSRQISAFSADQQTGQRTTRSGGNSNPMVTIYNNGNEVIGYPSSSHSMSEEFPSNGERGTSRSLSGSISSSVPGQTLLAMSSSSIIEDYADVMISRPSPNMPELHRQCSGSLPRGNSCAFDCSPQQRMVPKRRYVLIMRF